MVCYKNLKLSVEASSLKNASTQTKQFWDLGQKINSKIFNTDIAPEIKDDHTPLNAAGIPSFLVIGFNYPAFHTTKDTLNQCGASSLEAVAGTVLQYIYSQ